MKQSIGEKLTYIILTHNENIQSLVKVLKDHTKIGYRLIILDDYSTEHKPTELYCNDNNIKVVQHKLDKDYSEHRNHALQYVESEYCFYLDSDEVPCVNLLNSLPTIFSLKPDLVWIPRKNILKGIKPKDAKQLQLTLDGEVVNWKQSADYQGRILKVASGLRWHRRVHEQIKHSESDRVLFLPHNENCCIEHTKTFEKYIADNAKYWNSYTESENMGK